MMSHLNRVENDLEGHTYYPNLSLAVMWSPQFDEARVHVYGGPLAADFEHCIPYHTGNVAWYDYDEALFDVKPDNRIVYTSQSTPTSGMHRYYFPTGITGIGTRTAHPSWSEVLGDDLPRFLAVARNPLVKSITVEHSHCFRLILTENLVEATAEQMVALIEAAFGDRGDVHVYHEMSYSRTVADLRSPWEWDHDPADHQPWPSDFDYHGSF